MLKNQKGFTIIETLMAIVIFSITSLAATSMVIMTIKNNTTGNLVTMANMAAKEKLEQCAMNAWSLNEGIYEENIDGILKRTWKIEPHTFRSKRVTVWVSFKQGNRKKKRIVKVSTLVGLPNGTLNNGKLNDGSASW